MAVAFDNHGEDSSGTGSSYSGTPITVGSGSNMALLVWATALSSTTVTAISGTWNGTSLTAIGSIYNDGQLYTQLLGLVAPTSGAKTLALTFTGASGAASLEVDCLSVTGADQTGGTTTFYNLTTANGSSTTASVSVTSATNDMVVGEFYNGLRRISSTNQTQTFISGAANYAGNRAAGASSVTMTAALSLSGAWDALGVSIKAAAAAATVYEIDQPFDIIPRQRQIVPGWDSPGLQPPTPFVGNSFDIAPRKAARVDQWNQLENFPQVTTPFVGFPFADWVVKPVKRALPDWGQMDAISTQQPTPTPLDPPFHINKAVRLQPNDWSFTPPPPVPTTFSQPAPDAPFSVPARWQRRDLAWTQVDLAALPPLAGTVPLPWFDIQPRQTHAQARFNLWWNDPGIGNPVPIVVSTDIHFMPFFASFGQLKSW